MVELYINKYYNLAISHMNGKRVKEELYKEIVQKFNDKEYIIDINEKKIFAADNWEKPLYKFDMISTNVGYYELSNIK